ncbi:peptidoglycan-binding protein [Streptomyces sp. AC512_CC834]|uniref:peptidoglycan-binding protein n=1 Tax=Streptomyces sp. AC512_CC834 TaxID=2823691 RepID=UPI0027E3EBC0|nr:peptidoglycan-binding protein [Streptomyces sp. AC512_CC834]
MTGGQTEPVPVVEPLPDVDASAVESARSGAHAAPRRRRRRIRTAVALTVLTLTGAGVAVAAPWKSGSGAAQAEPEPKTGTAKVVRTDLTDTRILDGTLGYGTPRTLNGVGNGTVTWLASSGTTVSRGETLYRVDDRPVPALYGNVPMYRRLETPNTVGRDVRVIADNLRALGYDIGRQPGPGETVTGPVPPTGTERSRGTGPSGTEQDTGSGEGTPGKGARPSSGPSASGAPQPGTGSGEDTGTGTPSEQRPVTGPIKIRSEDGVLTRSLIDAVKRWQTSLGVPATGVIQPGDVAVLADAVRVQGAEVQTGDPADGPLLRITPTTKAVTVDVNASEVGSVKRGDAVTVRLPGGESAAAEVAAIGSEAKTPSSGQGLPGELRVTVTVAFKDPGQVSGLNSAPVQVEFGSESRSNVLAVPLTALLALREGGYGLQLAGGRLVAVETGLIAKGMVEVSGDRITEGARVVTAS